MLAYPGSALMGELGSFWWCQCRLDSVSYDLALGSWHMVIPSVCWPGCLCLDGAYLFCPWPASGHLVGQWPWLQQMSCGAFWLWGLQRDMHTGDFLPWLQLSFWMPLNCGIFRGTENLLICCPGCRRYIGMPSDYSVFRGLVKVLS